MGFPNIDKLLVKTFLAGFAALQTDSTPLQDIFEDLTPGEIDEITQYVARKKYTDDIRNRDGGRVYIMPNFPMIDVPFPQIAINLGHEDSDRYLADTDGNSVPVYDATNTLIGYDVTKGYYASSNWLVSVVAATKDETIWLSRCCQYFICQAFLDLEQSGLLNTNISMADMRPEQDQYPMAVFNRTIRLTGTTVNTWKKRVPVSFYQEGVNLAASQYQPTNTIG